MISLLITLLIMALIVAVVFWLLSLIPIPEPFFTIIRVIIVLLALLWVFGGNFGVPATHLIR